MGGLPLSEPGWTACDSMHQYTKHGPPLLNTLLCVLFHYCVCRQGGDLHVFHHAGSENPLPEGRRLQCPHDPTTVDPLGGRSVFLTVRFSLCSFACVFVCVFV